MATTSSLSALSSSIATTDLNQNNTIATLATTASLNALSSSIAVTDLDQNNRLTTIEGRYATTGSNTFVGTETISGSVVIEGSGNTALNVNGGNSLFSGSIIINGSTPSGSKFLFFSNASGSLGASITHIPSAIPSLSISAGAISGSVSIGTLQSGINTLFGDTKLTGSAHNITGSLGIRGNVQMTGSFTQTGSLTVSGSSHKIVGDTTLTGTFNQTGSLSVTGSVNILNSSFNSFRTNGGAVITGSVSIGEANSTQKVITFASASIPGALISYDRIGPSGTDAGGKFVFNSNTNNGVIEIGGGIGQSGSVLTINKNTGRTVLFSSSSLSIENPITTITGSLSVNGSSTFTGSIIQTGSVQGNVNALSISSNTASLNLNDANFFTLQLVSGSATHINPTNIKAGQTVSIFVNTVGAGTVTFPSSVKQISGSLYVPTTGTGLDILTLVSKDTSSLYLVNAKNFV